MSGFVSQLSIMHIFANARYVFVGTKNLATAELPTNVRYTHYSVYMKENRDISIKIRLTEAEKEQLLQRSKEEGKSLSSFIRESALKGRSISKTDVQMIYELRKIGANINQLAKHINTLPSDENILYSLDRINQYFRM